MTRVKRMSAVVGAMLLAIVGWSLAAMVLAQTPWVVETIPLFIAVSIIKQEIRLIVVRPDPLFPPASRGR